MEAQHLLPFIDQHLLLIAALSQRVAQGLDFITLLEVYYVPSDAQDNTSPVVAHGMKVWLVLRQGLDTLVMVGRIVVHAPAYLDVDRIDGGCLDPDEHCRPSRR